MIGRMAQLPDRVRLVIFDLDGVIYRGSEPVPGASELVAWLHAERVTVRFATNNSMVARAGYVDRLRAHGHRGGGRRGGDLDVGDDRAPPPPRGGRPARPGHRRRWDAGRADRGRPRGRDGRRRRRRRGQRRADRGASTPSSSGSIRTSTTPGWPWRWRPWPAARGWWRRTPTRATRRAAGFAPGAGAIVSALATATGVSPEVIGKPSPAMFEAILEASGIPADACVVVGDNPDADVAGAHRAGCAAILVLTGVADRGLAGPPRGRAGSRCASPTARRTSAASWRAGSGEARRPPCLPRAARFGQDLAPSLPRSRNARSKALSAIAASSSGLSRCASAVRASSRLSVVPVTVRSSVEIVTLTPARWRAASGCSARLATTPACTFEVGHRSSVTCRSRSCSIERSVAGGAHAVRDPLDPEGQHLAHVLRIRYLPGVGGEPQAALAGGDEGDGVRWRRPLRLRTGEVEPDDRGPERAGRARQLGVRRRRVRAHRGDDQSDDRSLRGPRREMARPTPAATASMTASTDSPRSRCRRGAHRISAYRIPSAARSSTSSSATRSQRGRGLEQRDRKVEEGQQLGLVPATLRPDHPRPRLFGGRAACPASAASSTAVASRMDPSRCWCSSAFGNPRSASGSICP